MNDILFPVMLVTGIGIVAAVGLVVASKLFGVPVDEKASAIESLLPGANCGGCGYSGCAAYASAISEKGEKTNLCVAGGADVAEEIGRLLGVESGFVRRVAVLHCGGGAENAPARVGYSGIDSCASVSALFGSLSGCAYGCIGMGDCAAVCPEHAISVASGLAHIDTGRCIGCGKCVSACPKHIISLSVIGGSPAVLCSNPLRGAAKRKACAKSCMGCGQCVRACGSGAVRLENGCAVIDSALCSGCGKCVSACRFGCISIIG